MLTLCSIASYYINNNCTGFKHIEFLFTSLTVSATGYLLIRRQASARRARECFKKTLIKKVERCIRGEIAAVHLIDIARTRGIPLKKRSLAYHIADFTPYILHARFTWITKIIHVNFTGIKNLWLQIVLHVLITFA